MTSFAILFSKVSYEPSGLYDCQIACPQYLWSSVEQRQQYISFFVGIKFDNMTGKKLIGFLGDLKTPKGHFEIN
jgi:hypothetical protein